MFQELTPLLAKRMLILYTKPRKTVGKRGVAETKGMR